MNGMTRYDHGSDASDALDSTHDWVSWGSSWGSHWSEDHWSSPLWGEVAKRWKKARSCADVDLQKEIGFYVHFVQPARRFAALMWGWGWGRACSCSLALANYRCVDATWRASAGVGCQRSRVSSGQRWLRNWLVTGGWFKELWTNMIKQAYPTVFHKENNLTIKKHGH